MSKVCDLCGKGKLSGNNVSHSNRKSRTSYSPNLQKAKVEVDGKEETLKVCTKCLKTVKKG